MCQQNFQIISSQLDQYYKHIEADRAKKISARTWFITVWIALLALIGSEKLEFSNIAAVFLIVVPVILFWIIESLSQAFIRINEDRAIVLEKMLTSKTIENSSISEDIFIISGWKNLSYKMKVKTFLFAFMQSESIIIFYIPVMIFTLIFLSILR
jgi:hypothetical protein